MGDESIGLSTGLIHMMQEYMALKNWPEDKRTEIMHYIHFLCDRANGAIPTGASWIRGLVNNHASYAHDSRLNDEVTFDVLSAMSTVNDPQSSARRQLLGKYA